MKRPQYTRGYFNECECICDFYLVQMRQFPYLVMQPKLAVNKHSNKHI